MTKIFINSIFSSHKTYDSRFSSIKKNSLLNRPSIMIKTVLFKPQQWMGFVRVFLTVKKPLRFLILYLSLSNKHMKSSDFEIHYRFKGKNQKLELRSVHDYCTFFEVYCRRDYWAGTPDMVVVDIGSNIGIPACFFLNNGTKFIY